MVGKDQSRIRVGPESLYNASVDNHGWLVADASMYRNLEGSVTPSRVRLWGQDTESSSLKRDHDAMVRRAGSPSRVVRDLATRVRYGGSSKRYLTAALASTAASWPHPKSSTEPLPTASDGPLKPSGCCRSAMALRSRREMLGLLPMPSGLVETCRRAPPCFSCLFCRCGLLSWWANDPGWRRLEPRPRFRSVARSAWMVVGCRAGEAQRDHVNDNCSIR